MGLIIYSSVPRKKNRKKKSNKWANAYNKFANDNVAKRYRSKKYD